MLPLQDVGDGFDVVLEMVQKPNCLMSLYGHGCRLTQELQKNMNHQYKTIITVMRTKHTATQSLQRA